MVVVKAEDTLHGVAWKEMRLVRDDSSQSVS